MAATKITLTSGNNQRAKLSSELSNDLVVSITDASDLPIEGYTVIFNISTIPQNTIGQFITGALQTVDAQTLDADTDSLGHASVKLTFGNKKGTYQVSAIATGLTGSPVVFSEIAFPVNAIVGLNQVKSYLAISESDISVDELLQNLINSSSDTIESYTMSSIVSQNYEDQIYDGSGYQNINLRHLPLVGLLNETLSDVQYRIDPTQDWLNIETDVKYLVVNPARDWELGLYRNIFPLGVANIKLNYIAGYTNVPSEIEQVCIEMVAERYKESSKGDGRLGRESIARNQAGGSSTDRFYELVKRHEQALVGFRRFVQ